MGKRAKKPQFGPKPLAQRPRTDICVDANELDSRIFGAIDRVAGKLDLEAQNTTIVGEIRAVRVRASLLRWMKDTHRAVRVIISASAKDNRLELSVTTLPLIRAQLESAFIAMYLEDDPQNVADYERGAGISYLRYFFRMQHLEGGVEEYWKPGGQGEQHAREWAAQLGITSAEVGDVQAFVARKDRDAQNCGPSLASFPTPGTMRNQFKNSKLKELGWLLYPWYDDLSHYVHSGFTACILGLLLREGPLSRMIPSCRDDTWYKGTVEHLATSHTCMVLAVTMFGLRFKADPDLMAQLEGAWKEISVGSPHGVQIWNAWAKQALGILG